MRRAEIVDGVVINVIEVNPDHVPEWAVDWPDASGIGIGWVWDGEAFAEPPAPPEPPLPPLTARQLRLVLLRKGITPAAVQGLLEQMDEPGRDEALIEWEYATQFDRDHPLIAAAADLLGIADEVDDWWREGMGL